MTRELKLALIVGFALVLVVTVLISDHLSHARQTRIADLPQDPVKMTEPAPIALEAGADVLPEVRVSEPMAVAPAPLIGSSPMSDVEPLVITQGSAGGASPLTGATQPAVTTNPQVPQQPVIARASDPIIEAVRTQGGRVEGDTIYLPGVQVREVAAGGTQPPAPQVAQVTPVNLNTPGPVPSTLPTTVIPTPPTSPTTPDRVHTVVSGDSVFKLSAKYYGDGKVWRKVARYNGLPEQPAPALKIGQQLKFPAAEVLLGRAPTPAEARAMAAAPTPRTTAAAPATQKTRAYTVKKGDTLAEIAQRELGTVRRAKDILELNKGVIRSADNIRQGMTIHLPG